MIILNQNALYYNYAFFLYFYITLHYNIGNYWRGSMEINERIENLIEQEKYDEALNLYNSKNVKNVDYIKQIVTGYINQGKVDSVMKKISKSFRFYNNRDLQYSIIKRLMKTGYNDEALEICQRDIYALDDDIKYKELFIYFKKEEYDKALEICNNPLFKRSEKIQYGKIVVLDILKRYDEIKAICEDETFKDSVLVQYPHVELLEEEKEYEKALEICLNPKFNTIMAFASKEKSLKEKINEISNKEALVIKDVNITPLVSGCTLDTNGLSQSVEKEVIPNEQVIDIPDIVQPSEVIIPTGKKKEKEYKVKVKTIHDSYEDELIELGTYYLRGLLNLEEPSFDKYAAALGTKMKIASEKRKGYDTGKTLSYEENLAITKYENYMETKKRIISAIDNIKYLEGRPITEKESVEKVLGLIRTYKNHFGNIDKTK